MTLLDNVTLYLRKRHIAFVDMFTPFYVCSAACHVFNLMNKEKEIFFEHGRIPDTRLHMFMVAPPGYMKSLSLDVLIKGMTSVFGDSAIKTIFTGSSTEAGFVGTIKVVNGEAFTQYGTAYQYKDYIIGIDEFSAITNAMRVEHSLNLDNAMLTALDSGLLVKTLALGELRYITSLSLWTGCLAPWTAVSIRRGSQQMILPIDSVHTGDLVFDDGKWAIVQAVLPSHFTGTLKRIGLRSNIVDITPNHVLFRSSKECYAGDIRTDDQLVSSLRVPNKSLSDFSDDLAWSLGFYCAEGWRHQDHTKAPGRSFHLTNSNLELMEYTRSCLEDWRPGSTCDIHKYRDCYDLAIHSSYADPFLQCHSESNRKIVPPAVLSANDYAKLQFLEGFMAGEARHREGSPGFSQAFKRSALTAGVMQLFSDTQDMMPSCRIDRDCVEMRAVEWFRQPFNCVVKVVEYPYSGQVYDLKTSTGHFSVGLGSHLKVHNSQPVRMDLTSGLGRRFLMIYFIPTALDIQTIKKARRLGKNVMPDRLLLAEIKNEVKDLVEHIYKVESISFDKSIEQECDKLRLPHYEEALFERLALGYNLVSKKFDTHLDITMDPILARLFAYEKEWRTNVMKGSEESQVVQILLERVTSQGVFTPTSLKELRDRLLHFGIPYGKQSMILERLQKQGRVFFKKEIDTTGKKGSTLVYLSPSER